MCLSVLQGRLCDGPVVIETDDVLTYCSLAYICFKTAIHVSRLTNIITNTECFHTYAHTHTTRKNDTHTARTQAPTQAHTHTHWQTQACTHKYRNVHVLNSPKHQHVWWQDFCVLFFKRQISDDHSQLNTKDSDTCDTAQEHGKSTTYLTQPAL